MVAPTLRSGRVDAGTAREGDPAAVACVIVATAELDGRDRTVVACEADVAGDKRAQRVIPAGVVALALARVDAGAADPEPLQIEARSDRDPAPGCPAEARAE